MKQQWKLPKIALIVWQLRIFSLAVIICGFLCIAFSLYVPSVILLALSAAISFIYLPCLMKSYVITVEKDYISVEKGVIIKTTLFMPRENLVYAESVSLPVSNALGLSAVVLKAARTFCIIPEIEKEKADIILSIAKDGENEQF